MNRVIKIISYLVFLIIVLEVLCRVSLSNTTLLNSILNCDIDNSWRLRWILNHKKLLKHSYHSYDSTKGWKCKRKFNCFENGKTVNFNTKGVRGLSEYSYTKPKDKIRILTIGDSFTFGEEVNNNQTFPFYLQEILPNTEVINLGVCGYGHDQMYLYLKEEGIKYNPDFVILGFVNADIKRNILMFRTYSKPKFKLISNKLYLTNSPVCQESILKTTIYKLKLLNILVIIGEEISNRIPIIKSYKEKAKIKLTAAILDEIVKTVYDADSIPIIVHITVPAEIDILRKETSLKNEEKRFLKDYYNDKSFLSAYCNKRRIYYIDTQALLLAEAEKANGTRLVTRGHWDHIGNYIVAKSIKDYFIQNNLLNSSKTKK